MNEDEPDHEDEQDANAPKRGRPRKVTPEAAPEAAIVEPVKRIKVTHYKIEGTSMGRLLEFQLEYLPASEADALIAKGWAVAC